ncbi:MAG TPA: DUF1015 domain-containing protein [Candidatus Saccharimonadales bacterium]|nr:DUF1015 domain-containing protein [Candidatus Saccharimonadales bacterium]
MAVVIPFKGLLYNSSRIPDLRLVVTPPYDVISPEQDEELRRRHPHNIVHLILPRPEGAASRYECAARTLRSWRESGILAEDDAPAFYLLSQKYSVKGLGSRTRLGVVARVRIEEDENRVIRPHERTMAGPREDRTDLLDATRTNLSPIFLLGSDPGGTAESLFASIASRPEDRWAVDDQGIESRLWRVADRAAVAGLSEILRNRTLWIADGHHRYAAARAYRDRLRAADGSAPGTRSYDYVMAYVTTMESPGVTILPYHRTLRGLEDFDRAAFAGKARSCFDVKEFPFEGYEPRADQIRLRLREALRSGRNAFAAYTGPGSFLLLLLKEGIDLAEAFGGSLAPPLRPLDVSVLHQILLGKVMGLDGEEQSREGGPLRYTHEMDHALSWVDSGEAQVALLLNATLKEQLVAVADAGLQMPQKSTYFYPKVLTGLVLNPLEPFEEIHPQAAGAAAGGKGSR